MAPRQPDRTVGKVSVQWFTSGMPGPERTPINDLPMAHADEPKDNPMMTFCGLFWGFAIDIGVMACLYSLIFVVFAVAPGR